MCQARSRRPRYRHTSKLPPSDEEMKSKLKLIKVFYENGGQMVTLGNTRSVDPKSTRLGRRFSRGVACESGKPLFPYMLKMVEDVHKAFPDMTIIAWRRHFFRGRRLEGIRKGCDSTLDLYCSYLPGLWCCKGHTRSSETKAWQRNPAEFHRKARQAYAVNTNTNHCKVLETF